MIVGKGFSSSDNSSQIVAMDRRKSAVAWLSVVANVALIAGKLVVGFLIASVSVISEGFHSCVDLMAAVMQLLSVKRSSKPPDLDHPYGHGKIENISGGVEAILIFAAGGWIIYEAFHDLIWPVPIKATGWGVGVMLVSAIVNFVVSAMLSRVGRETESVALQAKALHQRTDVYTSLGVMVALSVIWGCGRLLPGKDVHWIDPVAAIVVAALILKAAWDLTMQASRDLMDASLPAAEEELIRTEIRTHPEVRGMHKLRTRRAGMTRFIDFHIQVDEHLDVGKSHAVATQIASAIEKQFQGSSVTVYVEPCGQNCSPICLTGCLLTREKRDARQM